MFIPWQGNLKCDYEYSSFKDFNSCNIPSSTHKIHRSHSELNKLDFSDAGTNNVLTQNNLQTTSSVIEESDDDEIKAEGNVTTKKIYP